MKAGLFWATVVMLSSVSKLNKSSYWGQKCISVFTHSPVLKMWNGDRKHLEFRGGVNDWEFHIPVSITVQSVVSSASWEERVESVKFPPPLIRCSFASILNVPTLHLLTLNVLIWLQYFYLIWGCWRPLSQEVNTGQLASRPEINYMCFLSLTVKWGVSEVIHVHELHLFNLRFVFWEDLPHHLAYQQHCIVVRCNVIVHLWTDKRTENSCICVPVFLQRLFTRLSAPYCRS